jgi:hypothetical protein
MGQLDTRNDFRSVTQVTQDQDSDEDRVRNAALLLM